MAFKNFYLEDLTQLASAALPSTFIFSGDSLYIREECIHILKKRVLSADTLVFNLEEFNAETLESNELHTSLRSYPINSEHKLIIIHEMEKASKEIFEIVQSFIENPSKGLLLILIAENAIKFRFVSSLPKENYKAYKLANPYESQLSPWIISIAKKHKKKISPKAIEFLRTQIGVELGRLDKEIEKIACFIKDQATIEVKDIETLISNSKTVSIFEFTDALTKKDLKASIFYFNKLLDQKEAPLYIMTMMYRALYQIVLGQLYAAEGLQQKVICEKLKINAFFQKKFLEALKNFSVPELENIFAELSFIDSQLKTSRINPKIMMTEIMRKICATKQFSKMN